MKITKIDTIPVQVPIRSSLAIRGSKGFHAFSPFLLVKVHSDEGITGLGEVSCTPRWSGEDHFTAAHFIEKILAPELEGQDPTEIERLTGRLNQVLAFNPFTQSALEMALWDLLGKSLGVPVYRLLGGPVREFIPTKWSVSGVEPKTAAEIAQWAVSQGFNALKIKVGMDPREDEARVEAVRAAVGPAVKLGIDANGGWSARDAVPNIQRLCDYHIAFVEQPVPPGDPTAMAEIRRQVNVPIIADESVYTLDDAMNLARAQAADVFSVYVGKSGGIGPARKIADFAQAAGIGCTVGSNLEMGVGSAAMIHLAMATPGIRAEEIPCDIIGPWFYEDELLAEPLPICGGRARPHERPGLGVELDEEKTRRYTVS